MVNLCFAKCFIQAHEEIGRSEIAVILGNFVLEDQMIAEMFKKWSNFLLLNPLAPLIEGLEKCIVYETSPSLPWVLYSGAIALASLLAGFYFFKKWEPAFAESI